MAKKSIINRELKKEKLVLRYLKRRNELRTLAKSAPDMAARMEAGKQLQKLKVNSSPSRLTRRCGLCGRPNAVYRKFGLCRIHLREFLMVGQVPGGRKASW